MKNYAIILASGSGERFGYNIPKQFVEVNSKTLLEYSIDAFEFHKEIHGIILVSNPDFIEETGKIIEKNDYKKIINLIPGGKSRQESSYLGINALKDTDSNVLIHDAVRPFISADIITDCINALKTYKAVNVAIESSDTIIEVDDNNIIKNIPKRKYLRRCQTPQCFYYKIIKDAHELARKSQEADITDDCGLVIKYNLADIYVVNGSNYNIKITYPFDLDIAALITSKQKKES